MRSGSYKFKAIFRGAIIGFVAVVILLLVPIIGVRKGLQDMVLNWQELALYCACLITGTIAGARLALNRGSIYEDDDIETASNDSRPEPTPVDFEEAVELSLAGEPKKRRLGPFVYYFHHDRERTLTLLGCLYVILYVNCAALCQKLRLGIIVSGDGDTIIRSAGLGITLTGLYLCLRGVMRTGTGHSAAPQTQEATIASEPTVEKQLSEAEVLDGEGPNIPPQKQNSDRETPIETGKNAKDPHRPSPFRMDGSRLVYSSMVSHIPPTRFAFMKRNHICLGSLLVLTGLPLVFHAWFPLVAIPGIFIVMSWMFSGEKEKPGSLVVQSQQ